MSLFEKYPYRKITLKPWAYTRPDQSIKSDIEKPIDKSLSIDKIMLIDIDFIDHSIEIGTQLFSQNQSIFINRRKYFNFGINTAFYPSWYRISYEITSEREQSNKNGKSSTKTHGDQVERSPNKPWRPQ